MPTRSSGRARRIAKKKPAGRKDSGQGGFGEAKALWRIAGSCRRGVSASGIGSASVLFVLENASRGSDPLRQGLQRVVLRSRVRLVVLAPPRRQGGGASIAAQPITYEVGGKVVHGAVEISTKDRSKPRATPENNTLLSFRNRALTRVRDPVAAQPLRSTIDRSLNLSQHADTSQAPPHKRLKN